MFKIRLTRQAFSRVLGYERRIKKCLFSANKIQVKEAALVRPNQATQRRVSESKRMNPAISAGRVRKTRKGSAYGCAAESETWNSPSLAWRYSQPGSFGTQNCKGAYHRHAGGDQIEPPRKDPAALPTGTLERSSLSTEREEMTSMRLQDVDLSRARLCLWW